MLVLAILALYAGDPAELAPGPAQLADARAQVEASIERTSAIARAVARVHNAWGDRKAAGQGGCKDPAVADLPARSEILVTALRDAAQSTQVAGKRLRRIADSMTLAPLIADEERAAIDALLATASELRREQLELSSWHARYLKKQLRSCPGIAPGTAGLPAPLPGAREDGPTAVILPGDGVVCPANEKPFNRVAVVTGPACYGADGCACSPEPVAPAAILR